MTDPYQPPSSARTGMGQRDPDFRIIGAFEGLSLMPVPVAIVVLSIGIVGLINWFRISPLKPDSALATGCIVIGCALAQIVAFLRARMGRGRYFTMPLVVNGEAFRAGPATLWGTDSKNGRAGHLVLTAREVIFLEAGGPQEGILHVPVAVVAGTLLKLRDRQLYFRDQEGELIRLEVRNSKAWRAVIGQVANGKRLR